MLVTGNTTKLFSHPNILFKGNLITVNIEKVPFPFSRLTLVNNRLVFKISSCVKKNELDEFVKKQLILWLKSQARKAFQELVSIICKKYKLQYNDIRIKDTKSRWGSCSSKKNLNFNWRLIMAPETVLHYIVIHETAHLTELNHSKDFWTIVSNRCPNHKESEQWLKEHGRELLMYAK